MSKLLALIPIVALACKTEEPSASPPPMADEEAPVAVKEKGPPASLREVLLALPSTANGCSDVYDYFPGGGMRIFWCHVQTVLSFEQLGRAAGVKVFVSGPHQNQLALSSKSDFGHYNPEFVRWMIAKALPSATSAKPELADVYDRYLRERGRIYLSALLFLKANPEYWEAEKTSYLEHEDPQLRAGDHAPEEWPNEFPPAVAWWLRRSIDGTQPMFEEGLDKLLAAFDPNAKQELSARDWKIAEKPSIEPADLPFKGDSIDVKVKNAWAVLANLGPETACPDQFAYEPGGLRVQYCRAAAVIGYQALSAGLGFPIFSKGPHTKTELHLESTDFGHYNPRFVEWLVANAIPAATDPKLRAMSQPSYDKHLQAPARVFLFSRELLKRDAELKERLTTEYKKFLAKPEPSENPHWAWESFIPAGEYELQAIGGTALAFWIRRSMDGTDELFDRGLRKLMKTYDAQHLKNVEAAKTIDDLKRESGYAAGEGEEEYGD